MTLKRSKEKFICRLLKDNRSNQTVLCFFFVLFTWSICAQEENIYVGVIAGITNLDATWHKTVDNTVANSLVPESRRGTVLQEFNTSNSSGLGIGLLAGYRLPIAYKDVYLSIEFDMTVDLGEVEGRLQGIGTSAAKNQLGESWPDTWEVDANNSYGVSLKFSKSKDLIGGYSLTTYMLLGMTKHQADFTSYFYGCLSPTPCTDASDTPNFTSGSQTHPLDINGARAGFGIGLGLVKNIVLRFEARYTHYEEASWTDFYETINVNVPLALDTSQLGFRIGLTRYF